MKMEQTECPETSAHKIQTPGNYPEESEQYACSCSPTSIHALVACVWITLLLPRLTCEVTFQVF